MCESLSFVHPFVRMEEASLGWSAVQRVSGEIS